MDTKQFLERVLPQTGNDYFAAAVGESGLRQTRLRDIESLVKFAKINARDKDVYFATGTFVGRRDAENAELKKALYLDLDCGEGPNKYATKKDAVRSLVQFCDECFLHPSIIVDSGGGVHAYWVFETPIHAKRWRLLAEGLKTLCVDHGFMCDPVVTADAARILRVPGTTNFKGGLARPTRVFHATDKDFPVSDIEQRLGVDSARPSLSLAVDNDDLFANVGVERTYRAEHMVKQCPMFTEALATGGAGLPEMLWTQQLHVLAFCEDGADFAHLVSEGHADYTFNETQVKWGQRVSVKDRAGPTRCETFAQWSPKCQGCPHRGTVTTPLQLGTGRDNQLPYPYNQDSKGVFLLLEQKDDSGEMVTHRTTVFQYPIKDFVVVYDTGNTFIRFTADVAGVGKRVEMALADASDRKAAVKALAACHTVLGHREYNLFRDLMTAWVKRMQDTKQTQFSWSQLGWVEDQTGFALADTVMFKDGRKLNNLAADKRLAELYRVKGTKAPWLDVAHRLTSQGRFAIDTVVATAFAAPLMVWLRDASAAMAFVSTKSGSGKTTALELAQAVWGNPKHAMNQLDDTQASIFKKISYANNLPVYWDEVRAKEDAGKFIRMLFQLTGGKERSRLTQSVELRETGSWNTILTVASNESIAEHSVFASQDTEAGRARVFEVVVPTVAAEDVDAELNNLMLKVYENYGAIGAEYAEFLVKNHQQARKIVESTYAVVAKWQHDNVERFWVASATALLAGLAFAKQLGFVKTDLEQYATWLRAAFEDQRQDRNQSFGNEEEHTADMLAEFLNEHRSSFMIYDHLLRPGRDDVGRVYEVPKFGEIVGAIAVEDKRLRISRKALQAWMYAKRMGSPRLLSAAAHVEETRAVIVAGDGRNVLTKQRCYECPFPENMTTTVSANPFEVS